MEEAVILLTLLGHGASLKKVRWCRPAGGQLPDLLQGNQEKASEWQGGEGLRIDSYLRVARFFYLGGRHAFCW